MYQGSERVTFSSPSLKIKRREENWLCAKVLVRSKLDVSGAYQPISGFIWSLGRHFLNPRGAAAALVLIALAVGALTGCIPESKSHLERARILFDSRDLKGAKLELTAALKADPQMLEAHKLAARVDEYLGDQQDAALEYEAAARLDPADPKLRNKARFYRQQVEHPSEPSGKAEPAPAHGLFG